jgi:methylamine dehydrogenase heavy chain
MEGGRGVLLAAWGMLALGMAGAAAQQIPPDMPGQAQLSGEESHPTRTLPEPGAHWFYVLDLVFPHLIASKVYIYDGDNLDLLGMVNTGYTPNIVMAHDRSAFYAAETYWSHGTRGTRSDLVTVYDPRTLEITGEIPLPKGRFLVVTKKQNADLTSDGRYLLSFNMDPATSVSVVDVQEKKYVGEIETPGCGLVFPTGPTSFAMLCADGSFVKVSFDASAMATIEEGQPFFNSDEDPVFEHAALHRASGRAFFVSYDGFVYPVEFRDGSATVGERWKLQGEGEAGWRPGGWQLAAFHAATNRLFVLMHEGGRWTHKQAGAQVWVFDVAEKRKIHTVELAHHSISLAVTQDDRPLLAAVSEEATLEVFDATTYAHKAEREAVAESPYLLQVFGE